MLLLSRFGLMQEDTVGVPLLWFSLVLFFLDVKSRVLSGKIII